jgi:tetratricopeptide (TPR) repeat protein
MPSVGRYRFTRREMKMPPRALLGMLLVLTAVNAFGAENEELAAARKLYLRGNYEEAADAYAELKQTLPVEAAMGRARCHVASGERPKAIELLEAAAKDHAQAVELPAELARLALERGDYQQAQKHADAALKLDAESLPARWVQAELYRTSGQLKQADEAYQWFVDYYNQHDIADTESLHLVGLAAAQFARWNRLNDQFQFLINDLYPEALKAEADYWPARCEAGRLFLEKYNQAEAKKELAAALAINAQAADVYAAIAELALQNYDMDEAKRSFERALEIDPNHLAARQMKADWLFNNFQTSEAVALLEETRQLNPRSEETLGRLAACYVSLDGLAKGPDDSRYAKLAAEVEKQNPHCGEFYFTAAARLSDRKKFIEAEPLFLLAIERLPQLTRARGELGLMYMRLGQEAEAAKLLNESFDIDPFNVRVSNMLKVLEVLSNYATLETEHFIIRFDRAKDEVLARQAAKYLEAEVYPVLCQQFGFEPQGKSLFEIFSRARNTSGHGWFSARMVGLPYIGTVGACAGKMVALASPNDMEEKYNWARVLKHEFVHVLNLQQTNFNIPHWFTEALAVLNEGYPRTEVWNQLLAERVPKRDLFNLDTINLGFVRPKSSLDWQMAYCQAELYAEYLLKTYGDDALAKMLDAYADNLTTDAVLKRCFSADKAEVEAGYLKHLDQVVAELSPGKNAAKQMSLAELMRAQEADPENADVAAKLAQAQLERKAYPEARQHARKALELAPKHPLASYVLARIHLLVGDTEPAIDLLETALDEDEPDENVVSLLAALKLKAEEYDEAARLYGLAARHNPHDSKWLKALARVHLTASEDDKLAAVLVKLAEQDADEFTFRKKLAQMAIDSKDYPTAVRWATEALQIDVMDAELFGMLGQAHLASDKPQQAVEAYETALRIDGRDADMRLALAKAHIAAKQPDQARQTLDELLKRDPDNGDARQLLETLKP